MVAQTVVVKPTCISRIDYTILRTYLGTDSFKAASLTIPIKTYDRAYMVLHKSLYAYAW